jgi:hypothetical protein
MRDVLLYGTDNWVNAINLAYDKTEQRKTQYENIIEQINNKNKTYLNTDEAKEIIKDLMLYTSVYPLNNLQEELYKKIKNDNEIWSDADWKKTVINNYLWSMPIGSRTQQQQTQTTNTPAATQTYQTAQAYQEPKTSFSVQIPWYVYALGGGMLLLAGIVIFGKKKQ